MTWRCCRSERGARTREDERTRASVTRRQQRIQGAQDVDLCVTARVFDRIDHAGPGDEVHDGIDAAGGGRQGVGIGR